MKNLKIFLYRIKEEAKSILFYPVKTIALTPMDYDSYWRSKRTEDNLSTLSSWQKDRALIILKTLRYKKDIRIIDVGCGTGNILAFLKEQASVKEMVGIDSSEVALTEAASLGVETILSTDLLSALQKVKKADYVLFLEVLEHVADAEALLKQGMETATQGVFFSVPNTGFFTYRLRLLFGKFPLQWRVHPGEHVRFWTKSDLIWWLKALGISKYTLTTYKGVPLLSKLFPSLFAAAFVVSVDL